MRVLKAALIIMGVFILAGYAYLGIEAVKRFSRHTAEQQQPREAAPDERPLPPVTGGVVALGLPSGTRIGELVPAGNRLVFRVTVPDGPDQLYILDPRTGGVVPAVTTGKAAVLP
ncbi:hypothetical protein [Azospirillum sp. sgz301742]